MRLQDVAIFPSRNDVLSPSPAHTFSAERKYANRYSATVSCSATMSHKHRATSEQARSQNTYRSVHLNLTVDQTQWGRGGYINETFTNVKSLLVSLCLETQINKDLSHRANELLGQNLSELDGHVDPLLPRDLDSRKS